MDSERLGRIFSAIFYFASLPPYRQPDDRCGIA